MGNYEFYVNERLGVVVARLSREDFKKAVYSAAMNRLVNRYQNTMLWGQEWLGSLNDYISGVFHKWFDKRFTQKNIVARARCNFEDGDVFDEKIGTYIAADRMDIKITEVAIKFVSEFLHIMCEFTDALDDHLDELYSFSCDTEANMYKWAE